MIDEYSGGCSVIGGWGLWGGFWMFCIGFCCWVWGAGWGDTWGCGLSLGGGVVRVVVVVVYV
jgi:hypothetical protein